MGATLSSSKPDYNRVLARQPRTSITMPSFDQSSNERRETTDSSQLIPLPQLVVETNRPHTPEPAGALDARSVKSGLSARSDSPFVINNPKPLPHPADSSTTLQQVRSDPSISRHPTKDDYVVFARSLLDINDQQHAGKYCSAPFHPQRTVVERNGKQFLVELQRRTERRYVQCTDATTHRQRTFEVIDCIPYRVVRPCQEQSPFSPLKTGHDSQTSTPSTFVQDSKSNQYLQSLPYAHTEHNINRNIDNESSASTSVSSESDYSPETDFLDLEDEDYERIYYANIPQALHPHDNHHDYERKDPSLVTYRRDTGATHQIIGRYQLPTPSDSFVHPKSFGNGHQSLQWSDPSNITKAPESTGERLNQSSHINDTFIVDSSRQSHQSRDVISSTPTNWTHDI